MTTMRYSDTILISWAELRLSHDAKGMTDRVVLHLLEAIRARYREDIKAGNAESDYPYDDSRYVAIRLDVETNADLMQFAPTPVAPVPIPTEPLTVARCAVVFLPGEE